MKRVVLLLVLLTMVGVTNAQFRFTPHAGVSLYKWETNRNIPHHMEAGAQIGVDVRYSFNGNNNGWALQSGLYYQQRKSSTQNLIYAHYDNNIGLFYPSAEIIAIWPSTNNSILIDKQRKVTGISGVNDEGREDHLQLPVMVQYGWHVTDDIRLHASAGGYVSYVIAGKSSLKQTYISLDNPLEPQCMEYKYDTHHNWDMGFVCQAGIEVKQFAFLIDYQTNLYRRNWNGAYNLVSLSVGYTF